MTLVNAETGEVVPEMTRDEARALTESIKGVTSRLCDLVREARNRLAWKALGYSSMDAYAEKELGMTRQRLYQLFVEGEVISALEASAGVSNAFDISGRAARDIKPHIEELTAEVAEATAGVESEEERAAIVTETVEKKRSIIHDIKAREREAKGNAPQPPPRPTIKVDPTADERTRDLWHRTATKVYDLNLFADLDAVVGLVDPEDVRNLAAYMRSKSDELTEALNRARRIRRVQ